MWGYIGIALGVVLAVAVVGFAVLFLGFVKWVQSVSEENEVDEEALGAAAEDLGAGGRG